MQCTLCDCATQGDLDDVLYYRFTDRGRALHSRGALGATAAVDNNERGVAFSVVLHVAAPWQSH
jgi:hypothetical protein